MAEIIGLILPVILLPVERIVPFPYILEELVKTFVLYRVRVNSVWRAAFFGFLFSLSESVLYFSFQLNPEIFAKRLTLTGSMHVVTVLIIYFSLKRHGLVWVGLFAAGALHHVFNLYI